MDEDRAELSFAAPPGEKFTPVHATVEVHRPRIKQFRVRSRYDIIKFPTLLKPIDY